VAAAEVAVLAVEVVSVVELVSVDDNFMHSFF
jgi:hypothetical protein